LLHKKISVTFCFGVDSVSLFQKEKACDEQGLGMCRPLSGSEYVDPQDPTVIAETELLGAAASIEAAAKKLEQLKPRAKPKV